MIYQKFLLIQKCVKTGCLSIKSSTVDTEFKISSQTDFMSKSVKSKNKHIHVTYLITNTHFLVEWLV